MATLMYKIRKYQKMIVRLLSAQANAYQQDKRTAQHYFILDKTHRFYQIFYIGWLNPNHYVHNAILHLHISEDAKIWILANETEYAIGEELVQLGVPRQDIVLGFQPPELREYTDFGEGGEV